MAAQAFVETQLRRITYKPESRFYCQAQLHGEQVTVFITLDVRVHDAKKPGHLINIQCSQSLTISPLTLLSGHSSGLGAVEDEIIRIAMYLVDVIEKHETDEWLRLDGKYVHDPHPELRVASAKEAR